MAKILQQKTTTLIVFFLYGISGHRYLALFLLFLVIDGFQWFWVESLHRNIQLILEFLKAPFLVLHFSYYTLTTLLMMLSVIVLSMLNTLYSKCDQASALCQQLELASELESDLQDTVDWRKVTCSFQCWEKSTGFA